MTCAGELFWQAGLVEVVSRSLGEQLPGANVERDYILTMQRNQCGDRRGKKYSRDDVDVRLPKIWSSVTASEI